MHAKVLLAIALVLSAAMVSADPLGCHNAEARRVVAATSGITRIIVVGVAGSLKVTGHPGVAEVVATGTACSTDKDYVKEILLTAHRAGPDLRIEAVVPGQSVSIGWMASRLDFEVSVPDSIPLVVHDTSGDLAVAGVGPLQVDDGSGELTIRNVKGSVKVTDGAGGMTITNVTGDLEVDDGAGDIEINGVGGSVTIKDGSGGIDVRSVRKSVTIADDGSGGVHVRDVGGDFVILHKGSGAVQYERIAGRVSIPHRR